MSKAYVLLSGGIDSSTCLAIAKSIYGSATGIIIDYGQRHQIEQDYAQKVATAMDCPTVCIYAADVIGRGGLTDPSLEMPDASYAELPEGISPTYVPFRNGLFLSIAASLASADPEANAIYYGAHGEDAENDAYPDCSIPFITAMQTAIDIGTYGRIRLIAPLMHLTKGGVIRKGEEYGVPWDLTWSCYEGGALHCGTCPTCRARREAFVLVDVEDPTVYVEVKAKAKAKKKASKKKGKKS